MLINIKPIQIVRSILIVFMSMTSITLSALTLDEAIVSAIKGDPNLMVKIDQIKVSDVEINQGKSAFMPIVDVFSAIGLQKKNNSTTRLNKNSDVWIERKDFSATVKQNLFAGFNSYETLKRNDLSKKIKINDLLVDTNEFVLSVVSAYLNVIAKNKLYKISKINLKTHKDTHIQIQAMYKNGLSSETDFFQMNARLSKAHLLLDGAEQQLSEAKYKLKLITHQKANDLELPNEILIDFDNVNQTLGHINEHPTVKASEQRIDRSNAELRMALSALYPSLDFELSYVRTRNADGEYTYDENSKATLKANYNLFRGGADIATIKVATSDVEINKQLKETDKRKLILNVKKAWHNYESLLFQTIYLKKYLESNVANYQSTRKQFDIGQNTLLDLLQAANELHSSKTRFIEHEFSFYASKFKLKSTLSSIVDLEKIRLIKPTLKLNQM